MTMLYTYKRMKHISVKPVKELEGKDATVFGESLRPVAVEVAMRSGDHVRPVRTEKKTKKNQKPEVLSLELPKVWDIFAS